MLKKLIGGIMDNFKAADFDIKGNMKVKTLQDEFMKNFGLSLRIYKGPRFAEEKSTLASLKEGNVKAADFTLKAKMKIKEVIDIFKKEYGLKVNLADKTNEHLLPKEITLGQAARGEYDKDAQWYEKVAKK
jgi:hypothetical protein